MEDDVNSKCGIVVANSLHDVYSFIKDLQHRGREAFGIAAIGSGRIDVLKLKGTVGDAKLQNLLKIFPASSYHTYMAHVRYATKGREDRVVQDAHPHTLGGKIVDYGSHIHIRDVDAAIVHNGQACLEGISSFIGNFENCDTPATLDYYWKTNEFDVMRNIPGSYTLAIADKRRPEVIIMRDRFGIKPGYIGEKDGKSCIASENTAIKQNGGEKTGRDMTPGTIYYLYPNGSMRQVKVFDPIPRHCFFEWNYTGDIASTLDEISILKVRRELGKELARESNPADMDILSYIPECPRTSVESYAEESGRIPLDIFYKLKGERSFFGTNKQDRRDSIKNNLFINPAIIHLLEGKVVGLVDDSTIRGNNSLRAKELLLEKGVKKIYLLNYTPKIGIIGEDGIPRGCMFGVDMPPEDDFITRTKDGKRNRTDLEINQELEMNVYFLSIEGMFRAFGRAGIEKNNLCSFCIGGKHPFINYRR